MLFWLAGVWVLTVLWVRQGKRPSRPLPACPNVSKRPDPPLPRLPPGRLGDACTRLAHASVAFLKPLLGPGSVAIEAIILKAMKKAILLIRNPPDSQWAHSLLVAASIHLSRVKGITSVPPDSNPLKRFSIQLCSLFMKQEIALIRLTARQVIQAYVLHPAIQYLSNPDVWLQLLSNHLDWLISERGLQWIPGEMSTETDVLVNTRDYRTQTKQWYQDYLDAIQRCVRLEDAYRIMDQLQAEIQKKSKEIEHCHDKDFVNSVRVSDIRKYLKRLKLCSKQLEKKMNSLTQMPAVEHADYPSFDTILHSPTYFPMFEVFMTTQQRENRLKFWASFEQIKEMLLLKLENSQLSDESTADETTYLLWDDIGDLYDTFFAPEAPRLIPELVFEPHSTVTSAEMISILSGLQHDIYLQMEEQDYPTFIHLNFKVHQRPIKELDVVKAQHRRSASLRPQSSAALLEQLPIPWPPEIDEKFRHLSQLVSKQKKLQSELYQDVSSERQQDIQWILQGIHTEMNNVFLSIGQLQKAYLSRLIHGSSIEAQFAESVWKINFKFDVDTASLTESKSMLILDRRIFDWKIERSLEQMETLFEWAEEQGLSHSHPSMNKAAMKKAKKDQYQQLCKDMEKYLLILTEDESICMLDNLQKFVFDREFKGFEAENYLTFDQDPAMQSIVPFLPNISHTKESSLVTSVLGLFSDMFDLKERGNWMRRNALFLLAHQLFGSTLDRRLNDVLKYLCSDDFLAPLMDAVRATVEGNSIPPMTVHREEVEQKLILYLDDVLATIVGKQNVRVGARRIIGFVQNEELNRICLYDMLDRLLF